MRISDWSSDVCSSDLQIFLVVDLAQIDILGHRGGFDARLAARPQFGLLRREAVGSLERPCRYFEDRKSVVSGKSVSVRVKLGGCRSIKKKKKNQRYLTIDFTL